MKFGSYFKYIPILAAIVAVYAVYKDRGIEGVMADAQSLLAQITANPAMIISLVTALLVPIALLMFAPGLIRKVLPRGGWAVYLVIGVVTFIATSQIAAAVSTSKGGAGGGRGYVAATGYGNPYRRV